MSDHLRIRRSGASEWLLRDTQSETDVGGVHYNHDPDGNHYRAWLIVDGAQRDVGNALPQLAMAARAVEDAWVQANRDS